MESKKRQYSFYSDKIDNKKLKKKKNQEMLVLPTSSAEQMDILSYQNINPIGGSHITPRHIIVTDAIANREFEIRAIEKAISNATEHTGAIRIFQTIPRYQRRRAASYNIKRLPKYIRSRAKAQMDRDPEPSKKSITRRQKRLPSRLASFKAKAGAWLETHLWHVKRMKMAEMHGCKIALEPNQKSSRSLFRAACHESVIHDASYEKVIEIEGDQSKIVKIFECISDPLMASFASKHYIYGSKSGSIFLHEINQYPLKAIAKVNFLWKQNKVESKTSKLWIWTPLGTETRLLALIKEAHAFNVKMNSSISSINISLITDMIKFRLFGPRSHSVLAVCLQFIEQSKDYLANHQLWKKLKSLESSSILPEGVVLGLEIEDPLLSFPILMEKRSAFFKYSVPSDVISMVSVWPNNVAQSSIWDEKIREATILKRPPISSIHSRKSKELSSSRVKFDPCSDVAVPILLIHRMENTKSHMTSGWELIAPKGWGQLLWNTFVHSGVRVAGLKNIKDFHLEAGLPFFPTDFPECPIHHLEAKSHESQLQAKYNRTPKGRRFNFENIQWRNPFRSAFETLFPNLSITDLFVLHSERALTIIMEELIAGHVNFESFLEMSHSKIQKLMSQRAFCADLKNLSIETLRKSLIRILLDLPIGKISSHSKIHRTFEKALEVDSVVKSDLVIGFTSSGGYSLSNGRSSAIGCCTLEGIFLTYKSSERGLFIRSPTSRLSRFCTFTIMR